MAKIPRADPPQISQSSVSGNINSPASANISGARPFSMGRVRVVDRGPGVFARPSGVLQDPNAMTSHLRGMERAAQIKGQAAAQIGRIGQELTNFALQSQQARNTADLVEAETILEAAFDEYRGTLGADPSNWLSGWQETRKALIEELTEREDLAPAVKRQLQYNTRAFEAKTDLSMKLMADKRQVAYSKARLMDGHERAVNSGNLPMAAEIRAAGVGNGLLGEDESLDLQRKAERQSEMGELQQRLQVDPRGLLRDLEAKEEGAAESPPAVSRRDPMAENGDQPLPDGGKMSPLTTPDGQYAFPEGAATVPVPVPEDYSHGTTTSVRGGAKIPVGPLPGQDANTGEYPGSPLFPGSAPAAGGGYAHYKAMTPAERQRMISYAQSAVAEQNADTVTEIRDFIDADAYTSEEDLTEALNQSELERPVQESLYRYWARRETDYDKVMKVTQAITAYSAIDDTDGRGFHSLKAAINTYAPSYARADLNEVLEAKEDPGSNFGFGVSVIDAIMQDEGRVHLATPAERAKAQIDSYRALNAWLKKQEAAEGPAAQTKLDQKIADEAARIARMKIGAPLEKVLGGGASSGGAATSSTVKIETEQDVLNFLKTRGAGIRDGAPITEAEVAMDKATKEERARLNQLGRETTRGMPPIF